MYSVSQKKARHIWEAVCVKYGPVFIIFSTRNQHILENGFLVRPLLL